MILDTIANMKLYEAVNPYISMVIDYLSELDVDNLPEGKVEIDAENLFANFMVARGKAPEDATFETHNRMIDIQIVFEKEEEIAWIPRAELPSSDYNEAKDCTLYQGVIPTQTVKLVPGYFALFFPEDGHAPCISTAESYHKVVFKLKA